MTVPSTLPRGHAPMASKISMAAVPVVVGAALAWHPPDPVLAADLGGMLGRWLTIHLVLLLAMPLLALVVRELVRDLTTRAASVARTVVVPAAALYASFDALVGLGTGVLVRESLRLPDAERGGAAALVQAWWEVPAPVSVLAGAAVVTWTTAIAATAVALHRADNGRVATWALAVSAILFAAGHPGATGAAAMAAFAVAVAAAGVPGGRPRSSRGEAPSTAS